MNSLAELNGFGNTTITYEDNRDPDVLFDKPLSVNQSVEKNQAENHTVPVGINIVEIIRPADVGLVYVIDISATSGASLSWASIPTGVTVLNTVPGIYQIIGIDSISDWEAMKAPTYVADVTYVGTFNYTCSINWNVTESVTWTVSVIVNDVDFLNATPGDMYFAKSSSGTVTNNPTIIWAPSVNWQVTVTPSVSAYIQLLSSSGSGGTTSFNSTTKVLTITGTRTEVNSHLNAISYTTTSTAISDFSFTYFARNQTTLEGDSKLQTWNSTEILYATRSNDTYTLNTATTITGGPLINDSVYDGSGTYTMTVVPTVSSAISSLSSSGRYVWLSQNIDVYNRDASTSILSAALNSSNATYLANGDVFTTYPYGTINIYTRSVGGNVWTRQTTLTPPTMVGLPDCALGTNVKLNSDGSTLAVLGYEQNTLNRSVPSVNVWTRSGTTWTHQTRLYGSTLNSLNRSVQVSAMAMSSDGNTIAFSYYDNNGSGTEVGRVFIFTRSGSTWSEQATFTGSDTVALDSFGQIMDISDDGNVLIVSSCFDDNAKGTDAGAIYVFRRAGSSWSQETKLLAVNSTTNSRIGFNLRISSDGTKIWSTPTSSASIVTYQWIYSGGSWGTNTEIPIRFEFISKTGTVAKSSTNIVHELVSGSWVGTNTLSSTPAATEFLGGSADGSIIIGRAGYGSTSQLVIFGPKSTVGTSWNNSTKTLTLTGTRSEVNTDIDTITLTPATGYNSNITLTYTVITPRSDTDSRTQLITYTP